MPPSIQCHETDIGMPCDRAALVALRRETSKASLPFLSPFFICIVQILNKKKKKKTTKANSDIPATWFTTELLISINQFSRINESYAHAWLPGSRK